MWNLSYLTMGKNFGDSNLYFKLTSDIDLSGKNWQPICYSGYKNEWPANWYSFNANFNGNGKTITISSSSSVMWGFGLFSGIGGNVSNLIIKGNVVVTGFSGGLAGKLYNGANIQNVTSYVNISATDNQIAGIAGNVNDSAVVTISGCKNYGTVTSTGAQFTAGIIGGGWACVSLADCHNYGAVSGQSFVGGIIGELFVGTWAEAGLTNCTNNATVKAVSTTASTDFGTATLYVGNLVGKNN